MTHKQNLETLLAKVEAGTFEMSMPHCGFDVLDLIGAFSGSLTAARSLHKSVLGKWEYVITIDTVDIWKINSSAMLMDKSIRQGKSHDNPARAWLIAIIKALIAECE